MAAVRPNRGARRAPPLRERRSYPPARRARSALALWPQLARYREALLARWEPFAAGWHRFVLDGRGVLTLPVGDVARALPRVDARVDAWFLDGFTPARNPEVVGNRACSERWPTTPGQAPPSLPTPVLALSGAGWRRRDSGSRRASGSGPSARCWRGALRARAARSPWRRAVVRSPPPRARGGAPGDSSIGSWSSPGAATAASLAARGVGRRRCWTVAATPGPRLQASGHPQGALYALPSPLHATALTELALGRARAHRTQPACAPASCPTGADLGLVRRGAVSATDASRDAGGRRGVADSQGWPAGSLAPCRRPERQRPRRSPGDSLYLLRRAVLPRGGLGAPAGALRCAARPSGAIRVRGRTRPRRNRDCDEPGPPAGPPATAAAFDRRRGAGGGDRGRRGGSAGVRRRRAHLPLRTDPRAAHAGAGDARECGMLRTGAVRGRLRRTGASTAVTQPGRHPQVPRSRPATGVTAQASTSRTSSDSAALRRRCTPRSGPIGSMPPHSRVSRGCAARVRTTCP